MAETTTRIYELQVKLAQDSLAQLKKLQSSTSSIEQGFKAAGDTVKNFALGLASAFSVGALISAIDSVITKFDDMAAAAQRIAMPIEDFSALAYAASQADLEMADLEIGLKELQKSMVETETKGAKVLDVLKIDKTKPQIEVLKDFAEAFKTIQDPALRTNALIEVFGKSGLKLRPLLEQGAAGMQKLIETAKELGLVVSEDAATAFSDLDNAIKTSQQQTAALGKEMVLGLQPALIDILGAFTGAKEGASAFEGVGKALGVFLRGLSAVVVGVAHGFRQLGEVIYGVMMTAANLFIGERTTAKSYFDSMLANLEKNDAAYAQTQKQILGFKDATDASAEAITHHEEAVKNNDKAIRKALSTDDKKPKKKEKTEYEKLTESLDDQLAALQRVESEYPELDKALAKYAESLAKLSPQEAELAYIRVQEIAAMEQANKKTKELRDAREELANITKSQQTEWEKYLADLQRYEELMAILPEREDELREAMRRRTDAFREANDKVQYGVKKDDELIEKLADKIDGYAKSMSESLIDFATGAQDAKHSFSDMMASILRDMAKMATQMLIMEPMMKQFKDWLKTVDLAGMLTPSSGLGADVPPGGPWAKGGVFTSSPSLSRYSGGVYDSPRVFTYAKGAGVFAEAGPEAIMPLTRGPDGSLGVDASGSGVVVNVYNESKAEVTTQTRNDVNGRRVIELMVKDAVSAGFRSGAFDGVMGSTYGLNRQGAR
jgi:hypothetical protein